MMTTKKTKAGGGKRAPARTAFHIFTIFPRFFDSFLGESLLKRAIDCGLIEVGVHNIRDFAEGRHQKVNARGGPPGALTLSKEALRLRSGHPPALPRRRVDSRPFGGGPGMVLEVGPIYRAIVAAARKSRASKAKRRIILLSPRGKPFTAAAARNLALSFRELFFICGRYEGVDERVATYVADESYSVGPYVLNGGEVGAMAMIEAVSRFVPGFLGKGESLEEVGGSHAAYARPPEFVPDPRGFRILRRKASKRWIVPKVLRSGHHAAIKRFRERTSRR